MAPPLRILKQQQEILVDFLEANKDMSNGSISGSAQSQQANRQKWAAISKKLNSVESGALKTPKEWKMYWFQWRHKCRRKAADARRFQSTSDGIKSRFIPLNDLEVRIIELCGSAPVTAAAPPSKELENFLAEDSDSEPLENMKVASTPIVSRVKSFTSLRDPADDEERTSTPPPKWAIDFEERRIAAEERMAEALESIASVMRSQEERRAALDERIADAITAVAGTMQDLNSGIHEALQHLPHQQPAQNGMQPKDEIFY